MAETDAAPIARCSPGLDFMTIAEAINIDDLKALARRRLPRLAFDFIEGGVEDEEALAYNQAALRMYRLVPRYMTDVSAIDTSVEVFGHRYSSPFGIAPTGLSGFFRRNADAMLAQAASEANIPYAVSCVTTGSLEAAARLTEGRMWFQVYVTNTRDVTRDLLRRARDAGVQVLLVTVDVPISQKRERNMRNGFGHPLRLTPSIILQGLARPAWTLDFLLGGGMPMLENWRAYAPPRASADTVTTVYGRENPCSNQTWSDLEEIRRLWSGKLVVKGVLHPEDAARAVQLGADGVYVSNHGGRQYDRAPSPIEMLPEIRQAVGPEVTLLMDSGVRRGSDVVLAHCLGAKVAMTGRATMYGAAAGGLAGVRRAVAILQQEVQFAMGALGCSTLDQLGPQMLRRSLVV